ncbi:MAG: hypothetical protein KDC54_04120 [Lewinella sp.]|nr:hypothetical protein [Lewinella sp.]
MFLSVAWRMPGLLLFLFLAVQPIVLAQAERPGRFRLPTELKEVSGLVFAAPDSLWWHNDSGNAPTLYLTDGEGRLRRSLDLPQLRNIDWEDLTTDDAGNLYVGDFGDNRRQRTNLHVYRIDPVTGAADSIEFYYSDERHYDVEAFFWHRDSLHLFTKHRLQSGWLSTHHFVLPASPGAQVAVWRDSLALRKRVVTGAAIEPATGEVVLVAYYFKRWLGFLPWSSASVFVLDDYPEGHYLRGEVRRKRISCLLATQYESVDFANEGYLLVASEQTVFIRPRAKPVRR